MIQLNLLPDVKLEYLKAQRTRRLATAISFIVTAVAVAILVLLLAVEGFQKHTLSNLNKNIALETTQLQKEPQINSILTVQSQLDSVNKLHASAPAVSKLFDYLNELTPTTVTIGSIAADFAGHSFTLTGTAGSLSNINQFVDTIKFTKYNTGQNSDNVSAFSSVVLSGFSLNTSNNGSSSSGKASYSITFNFDPVLFDITKNVSLIIPSTVTTRSDLEHPGPLFVNEPSSQNSGGKQ